MEPGTTNRTLLGMMPPELLGEIFTYASSQNPEAPLIVGSVCSAFRHIVRRTPKAWTRLYLECAPQNLSQTHYDERSIRKMELYFSMAGVCPVDLHVQVTASDPQSPHPSIYITGGQQLAHKLYLYRQRIHGLALYTTTVDEAEQFFSVVYPRSYTGDSPLPLDTLTFHASSDGVHRSLAMNLAHLRHKHKPATCISLSHCQFPNLAHLKFVNHPFPDIISDVSHLDGVSHGAVNNASNLRSLSIVYPIRFAPISVARLLQVLESAPLLEKLEIEARIIDGSPPNSPMQLNPTTSYFGANATDVAPPSLITLPFLTHLSLRVNNLPVILSHLLLPSLDALRIDDLDGKRVGAAAQTATVLRQLLVRMDLPCAEAPPPAGLRSLDMCGVALPGGHGETDEATAVWAWCVRRMRTLVELRASKMDTAALWALITPPPQGSADEVVLPNLRRLAVLDYGPQTNPKPLSPFSFFDRSVPTFSNVVRPGGGSVPCGSLIKFQLRRPDVQVDYHIMHDENHIPPGVDFLTLYAGH